MRISIASDHGGFEQKQKLASHLEGKGLGVVDRGPAPEESVDYPDFAKLVCEDIQSGEADLGILVCGTGIGMAIAANKMAGIRAANATCVQFAHLAREHNDANVLTLSGRFVTPSDNEAIVDEFISTPFGGDRHARRVGKIMALEG